MSILIKDMEMPKNCAECERWSICKCLNDFEDYESICYAVEDGDLVRDANCPLIELPPHGRLIDVDKLNIHDVSPAYGFCVMGVTEEDIELADTVIEAEGET